jgi:hypothetical protein
VADWVLDDQPVWIHANPRPVLSVPYTVEINDIPMMLLQQNRSEEMLMRGIDQISDRLWGEGATHPRVMAISVRPYVTGDYRTGSTFTSKNCSTISRAQSGARISVPGRRSSDWYRQQVPAPSTPTGGR